MINRFFHKPELHLETPGMEKKANWLELFYDLIYVAAFIQLGNAFSESISFMGFIKFAGIFVPLWLTWTGFTFYANRYNIDDFIHRAIVFVHMFAVGSMAMTAPLVLKGEFIGFALSYTCAQSLIALMYFRSWLQQPEGRGFSSYWGSIFFASALIWLFSTILPPQYCVITWILGSLLIFIAPLTPKSKALMNKHPYDHEHLAERYGLLTIIVLGESFVKVLGYISSQNIDIYTVLQASFALTITCSIWWIYFDDIANSHLRHTKFASVQWLFSHLPLQLGIIGLGVSIKKAVSFDLSAVAPFKYALLLCGCLAIIFIFTSIIDLATHRRDSEIDEKWRTFARFFSGVLILLMAFAAAPNVQALWLLILVLFVCVGQIAFDIIAAPELINEKRMVAESQSISDIVKSDAKSRISSLAEPVKKGLPSELKKDLYFYFMESSWKQFFTTIFLVYILVNILFASLYMLMPGSIANADAHNFWDAFFFSVQTLSTIGYGALSPIGVYSNVIVTIEAGIGLLGVALVTGLLFAKVSKPESKILFSRNFLIQNIDDKPHLVFRIGNARGNDIVEANITVSALIDHVSKEGLHLRKVSDLKLVRKRTPFFKMTWTIMHPIDEESPLKDIDWKNPKNIVSILVTITGHDGTYGSTVYSRHIYAPEDVLEKHTFVDIINQLPDGRFMIDYDKFHAVHSV